MKTSETSLIDIAVAELTAMGGPDKAIGPTVQNLFQKLKDHGATTDQAAFAISAAVAQLQARAMPVAAHIDVDLCTAYMVAVRSQGQTRFVPLSAIQLIVGSALQHPPEVTTNTPAAPHAINTIH